MPIYAFGFNGHGQIDPEASVEVNSPVRLENCSEIVAASWSQAVLRDAKGKQVIRGLPLESVAFDFEAVKSWLGQDEFLAVLLNDGKIVRLVDGAATEARYRLASMNSRGELLVVPEESPTDLVLYPSLASLYDSNNSSAKLPSKLSLPFYPSTSSNPERISSIAAGASHFLILTFPSSRLFSIGDNRYGQLGVPHSSASNTPQLRRIDTFDGIRIVQIAAGAFHSVVLTEGGEVYLFGSDKEGQCGGNGGGWEPTTNEELGEGLEAMGNSAGEDEDEDEIVQVCAAGESTILRTRAGELWVCGANHSGQLGLPTKNEKIAKFTKLPPLGSPESSLGRAGKVVCSRWTTYVEVE
ncbi:hypothetical protein JCM5353_005171 [Sporobolomyces roseus]